MKRKEVKHNMAQKHIVTDSEFNQRVDKILVKLNPERSRSQIQLWIEDEYVTVNEKEVKANYKCKTGDIIKWSIPEVKPLDIISEDIPLSIIYEDSDLVVVNKPRGMVVHPSAGHQSGTLVNALLHHCKDLSGINGVERPGIVHRIDKDTSGLLVVAKNDQSHLSLAEQLANREIERRYEAIVHGVIDHEEGMIDAPIGRDPKDRQKMGVVDDGKPAITHFHVLQRFANFTHVECQLETGRTHQIRVHMKYINHPLVGDPKYGLRKTLKIDRQALHDRSLGFKHPTTGQWMSFEEEPPCAFKELLDTMDKMY